eukprot:1161118-Pelagomonas_calceolata.AAC.1
MEEDYTRKSIGALGDVHPVLSRPIVRLAVWLTVLTDCARLCLPLKVVWNASLSFQPGFCKNNPNTNTHMQSTRFKGQEVTDGAEEVSSDQV